MAIYAIGDLHLGHAVDKPMGIFGHDWANHPEKIRINWLERVTDDDTVLIPGDISWAMTLAEALPDLDFIAELPGRKVMTRGNHDYWWNGISKIRAALSEHFAALQNDSIEINGVNICGTRGWLLPTHPKFTDEDEKLYQREASRLRMSLASIRNKSLPTIVMLHYPPCGVSEEDTLFTSIMEEHHVNHCIYGHLHGAAHRFALEGIRNGVHYQLVSADYLDFSPIRIDIPTLDSPELS